MHINFVTSGFPNGFTNEFVRELKKYLSSDLHFAFVASDFSVHEKTDIYTPPIISSLKLRQISIVKIQRRVCSRQ